MKIGAIGILITMLTGFLAWGGTQIFDNARQIARLDERDKTSKELLKEVRDDVKKLLKARY